MKNLRGSAVNIRPLNPVDLLRLSLSGQRAEPDRAHPLTSLGRHEGRILRARNALGLALPSRSAGATWIAWQGKGSWSLAASRPRLGPSCHEIVHLLAPRSGEGFVTRLLERVCQASVADGAEKVCLRVPCDNNLVDAIYRAGFAPCVREVLYKRSNVGFAGRDERPSGIRRRMPSDEHGLFRLYHASTPAETRLLTGMTLKQWSASREPAPGRGQEFVVESETGIEAWLRASAQGRSGHLEIVSRADWGAGLAALVDFGLSTLGQMTSIYILVPEHQAKLHRVLAERRFSRADEYLMLVKSMTVPQRQGALLEAPAASA